MVCPLYCVGAMFRRISLLLHRSTIALHSFLGKSVSVSASAYLLSRLFVFIMLYTICKYL